MTIPVFTVVPSAMTSPDTFASDMDIHLSELNPFVTAVNEVAAAFTLLSTTDTSATINTIGTGAKTFTVTAGKSFAGGMWLILADTAAPSTNSMFGQVTSYSGTSLVMNVVSVLGSGTKTAWTISQSAPGGASFAGAETLTNKTMALGSNTITGTIAQFNTACTDADFGSLNIPQNSRSAGYTCVIGDAGNHILHPSADTSARTFTIPANSSVAYPIGTAITFINQNGGGVITIAITTDTMRQAGPGTTGSRSLAANGMATVVKVTSTEWIISGVGLT
jgi:hypothetical protein